MVPPCDEPRKLRVLYRYVEGNSNAAIIQCADTRNHQPIRRDIQVFLNLITPLRRCSFGCHHGFTERLKEWNYETPRAEVILSIPSHNYLSLRCGVVMNFTKLPLKIATVEEIPPILTTLYDLSEGELASWLRVTSAAYDRAVTSHDQQSFVAGIAVLRAEIKRRMNET